MMGRCQHITPIIEIFLLNINLTIAETYSDNKLILKNKTHKKKISLPYVLSWNIINTKENYAEFVQTFFNFIL